MNKAEFKTAVKRHDWYYCYSDDHGVWTRGRCNEKEINHSRNELDCPFNMGMLRKWVHGMILEQFEETEPGKWYRQPREKYVAAAMRDDLITQDEFNQIEEWFNVD